MLFTQASFLCREVSPLIHEFKFVFSVSSPMYDAAAQTFREKLLRKSKSLQSKIQTSSTRGELRQKISLAHRQLNGVVDVFRCVLHQMCTVTHSDYQVLQDWPAWHYRWKRISNQGYNTRCGGLCKVDYGNMEYKIVLQFLYLQDAQCKHSINYLAHYYWPAIHPNDHSHDTNHGVSMQGDVIEICLAALSGHPDFDMTAELARQKCLLPTLLSQVCQLCQLVQYVDAAVSTGWIKASKTAVIKLCADKEEFRDDVFMSAWLARPMERGSCLHALLNIN